MDGKGGKRKGVNGREGREEEEGGGRRHIPHGNPQTVAFHCKLTQLWIKAVFSGRSSRVLCRLPLVQRVQSLHGLQESKAQFVFAGRRVREGEGGWIEGWRGGRRREEKGGVGGSSRVLCLLPLVQRVQSLHGLQESKAQFVFAGRRVREGEGGWIEGWRGGGRRGKEGGRRRGVFGSELSSPVSVALV
jgi:hypothetical protein